MTLNVHLQGGGWINVPQPRTVNVNSDLSGAGPIFVYVLKFA